MPARSSCRRPIVAFLLVMKTDLVQQRPWRRRTWEGLAFSVVAADRTRHFDASSQNGLACAEVRLNKHLLWRIDRNPDSRAGILNSFLNKKFRLKSLASDMRDQSLRRRSSERRLPATAVPAVYFQGTFLSLRSVSYWEF